MSSASARSEVSNAFRRAVASGQVDRAQHLWDNLGRHYPAALAQGWDMLQSSDLPMEAFLQACSSDPGVRDTWRSKSACRALLCVREEDAAGWDRRWAWAKDHIRWKKTDHLVLAHALVDGAISANPVAAAIYRSRLEDVLAQKPFLSGLVWGNLGKSESTRDLAEQLPHRAHTTPPFRGGLLAMAAMATPLRTISKQWLNSFVELRLPIQTNVPVRVDLDRVKEEFAGAQALATLLRMERTDLFVMSHFSPTIYEEPFDEAVTRLDVFRAWALGHRATMGSKDQAVAHLRQALMEMNLEAATPSPGKVRL